MKVVLLLSVLIATSFLSQLRKKGRKVVEKMEIVQGRPCRQVSECMNGMVMQRHAEVPPTQSWQAAWDTASKPLTCLLQQVQVRQM